MVLKNWNGYLLSVGLATAGMWTGCAPPASEDASSELAATVEIEPTPTSTEEEGTDEDAPTLYVVRAEVTGLPDPGDPDSDFRVQHEAIDDLVGIDGNVWGMDAMEMPFLVAEDVPLTDFAVGDKVELTLAVDWFGAVPQQVTKVDKLPPETVLEFRPAAPPG